MARGTFLIDAAAHCGRHDWAGIEQWPPSGGRAQLLIVDDMPESLSLLGGVLEGAGYRVRAANCGFTALRYAAMEPIPDLILLDVGMPVLDGYEVLRRLRQMPVTREIPVIFVTARNDPQEEEYGIVLGAADYLAKPIRPAVALARVRSQLASKLARDRLRTQTDRLTAEVAHWMHENELIQTVSIRALAHLAETRDNETGNHILRTQAYVRLLARKLARHPRFCAILDERYIALLARSAALHDIGKVGIPDHILMKPGRLTAEEWEVMKTHARLGSDAIDKAQQGIGTPLEFLALAREIARWHHERWDGGGYPDGLAGEAIPVSARIMALADVFDALVSARVYKAAMPLDEVKDIIAAGRGTHFDPDIADAFLADVDEFVDIAQRYRDHP